jgi:hypothetical protein
MRDSVVKRQIFLKVRDSERKWLGRPAKTNKTRKPDIEEEEHAD